MRRRSTNKGDQIPTVGSKRKRTRVVDRGSWAIILCQSGLNLSRRSHSKEWFIDLRSLRKFRDSTI
jgi:hypothetical protein